MKCERLWTAWTILGMLFRLPNGLAVEPVLIRRKFEEGFYAKSENPSPQAVPAEGEPTISMTALLELLKNADPEVKAQLRLALLI